jgi:hypothetical protein
MIAEMEAKQKAKTEAENKARFPGGSTTIRSGPMGGTESAAATRGLRGGGMQATRSFEEVSKEYDTANATLHRMLDRGGSELAINARRREISRLEGELRGMGARRSFGTNWEMPPKKGTPEHAAEMRKREYSSIVEQLHDQHREAGAPLYSPEELAGVRSADIKAQLNSGQKAIVVKVPSGSEIHMSPEMARQLLQKNKDTAALASVKRLTDKGIMTPQKSAGPRLPASDYGKMTLEQLQGLEKIYQQPLQRGGNAAQAQHQMTELTAIQAEMQKRQRRARQQGRLAEAAGRRGITNRRKAT